MSFWGRPFKTSKKTRLCKIVLIILQLSTICFSANEHFVLLIHLPILLYFSIKNCIVQVFYILIWNSKIKYFPIKWALQIKYGKIAFPPNVNFGLNLNALSDVGYKTTRV